jgi:hypothetical protein
MNIALPLDKMTVEEKLRAMEALWADLSRAPAAFPHLPVRDLLRCAR